MKATITEILSEFYQDTLPKPIKRAMNFPTLPQHVRKAFVFIGMRRVGKTYLMYQHMLDLMQNGLAKEKLLYINFEDDRLAGFTAADFQIILDVHFERYPNLHASKELVFFFDEIQEVDGWEKFIRRLLDKEQMSIFITGSSAKLLSKEIATSLRGRSLEKEIFPLGLDEYLHYQGIDDFSHLSRKNKSAIAHHAQIYLKRGGFPEILDVPESVYRDIIQSYVNAAVFRDVIERHDLKNTHIIKAFLLHCLQNIAAPLSITKVYKTFKSRGEKLGRDSLYEYLHYFEEAYLIFSVPIFELSTRKRQVNPSKIYCADPSIINAYSVKPQMEQAACLENAVYIHLRKQQYEGIYYYKTTDGKEIDFIAQEANGTLHLFQVCIDLSNEDTRKRELTALVKASVELNIYKTWLITLDTDETIELSGVTIHAISYWQWVLQEPA